MGWVGLVSQCFVKAVGVVPFLIGLVQIRCPWITDGQAMANVVLVGVKCFCVSFMFVQQFALLTTKDKQHEKLMVVVFRIHLRESLVSRHLLLPPESGCVSRFHLHGEHVCVFVPQLFFMHFSGFGSSSSSSSSSTSLMWEVLSSMSDLLTVGEGPVIQLLGPRGVVVNMTCLDMRRMSASCFVFSPGQCAALADLCL